jgi:hypothetical protein
MLGRKVHTLAFGERLSSAPLSGRSTLSASHCSPRRTRPLPQHATVPPPRRLPACSPGSTPSTPFSAPPAPAPAPRPRLDEVMCVLEVLASMALAPAVVDAALPPAELISATVGALRARPEARARGRERTHLLLLYPALCGCITCKEPRVRGAVHRPCRHLPSPSSSPSPSPSLATSRVFDDGEDGRGRGRWSRCTMRWQAALTFLDFMH